MDLVEILVQKTWEYLGLPVEWAFRLAGARVSPVYVVILKVLLLLALLVLVWEVLVSSWRLFSRRRARRRRSPDRRKARGDRGTHGGAETLKESKAKSSYDFILFNGF